MTPINETVKCALTNGMWEQSQKIPKVKSQKIWKIDNNQIIQQCNVENNYEFAIQCQNLTINVVMWWQSAKAVVFLMSKFSKFSSW